MKKREREAKEINEWKQARKKEKEIEIAKSSSLHIKVSWVFCT